MAVTGVQFRCDGCRVEVVVPAKLAPRSPGSAINDPVIKLPEGWRRSYGASGRGLYHQCASCEAQEVRIDDSDGTVHVDIGGFVDD